MKMKDKEVYLNLEDYVKRTYDYNSLPDKFHNKSKTSEWNTCVYQKWAAYEILKSIKKLTENGNCTIIDALEYIRETFDDFSCKSIQCNKKFMFIEGYMVATDLLDMAIGYTWCY